jgi:hypothetical protein
MELRRRVLCGLGCAGILGGLALAQSDLRVTLDNVMTRAELRATGIAGLTPAQRVALDRWISEYASRLIRAARADSASSSSATYTGGTSGHWIESKGEDGDLIVLEDDSVWAINSLDQIDTVLWLPTSDVTVVKANSPVGEYKYTLVNTDDKENALAKYLGKR